MKKKLPLVKCGIGLLVLMSAGIWLFRFSGIVRETAKAPDTSTKPTNKQTESVGSSRNMETTTVETTTLETTLEDTAAAGSQSSTDGDKTSLPDWDDSRLTLYAAEVSYGIYYFDSGMYFTNDNHEQLISASVIKIFIMAYVYEKKLDLQTLVNGEPIGELVRRMIQVSDNTATNSLIDFIGINQLNAYFSEAGYGTTSLQRRMSDGEARSRGIENYTSLDDTLLFLTRLYENQQVYPYSEMLTIMLGQQVATKIRSQLPAAVPVANKTGELDTVENDIGLVFDEGHDFAIVVLTNGVNDSRMVREAIGQLTYQAFIAAQ